MKNTPSPENHPHYFRRCHVCGHVNEINEHAAHHCASCGKHLPLFYYFNELETETLSDDKLQSETGELKSYSPIRGLSTFW